MSKTLKTGGTEITEICEWDFFASTTNDDGTSTFYNRTEADVDEFLAAVQSNLGFAKGAIDPDVRERLIVTFCSTRAVSWQGEELNSRIPV